MFCRLATLSPCCTRGGAFDIILPMKKGIDKKDLKKKEVTINDLAVMVAKGFSNVDKRIDGLEERMDKFEDRVGKFEEKMDYRLNSLSNRIDASIDNRVTIQQYEVLVARVNKIEDKVNKK